MQTRSKTFAATGNGEYLRLAPGQSATYNLTGSFSATLILESTRNGGITFETVTTLTAALGSALTLIHSNLENSPVNLRWRCSVYASGSPATTIADAADEVPGSDIVDGDGVEVFKAVDGGIEMAGTLKVTGQTELSSVKGNDADMNTEGDDPASATAAGGAVSHTGGIGGATSGAGGAVTNTGGAGTAGNSAGGLASQAGGAGQGSAAGGAATQTGGLGGATGIGGASSSSGGAGQGTAAGGVASVVGGASGGGATGNGGVASLTGGLAASTNGSGGAASQTGGLATGTGTGGAASLRGGASGGASGTAGAVAIDSGAATGGTGAGVLIGDANAVGVTIGGPLNYAAGGGAADVQTLTLNPAPTRYVAGMMIAWRATADNTGACTMNVNGLGAKDVKTQTGVDPAAGDLQATTGLQMAMYDGTNFVLINPGTTTD